MKRLNYVMHEITTTTTAQTKLTILILAPVATTQPLLTLITVIRDKLDT